VWLPILDRAWIGQDKPVRRKPSRIPVPGKEVWQNRALVNTAMRITLVGATFIAAAIFVTALVIWALAQKHDSGTGDSYSYVIPS
jgi:hypothetical protein